MTGVFQSLGELDAERFITLIIREPFDYTKWQRNLFEGESVESLAQKANKFSEQQNIMQEKASELSLQNV